MGKKYIVELGMCERLYKAFINGNEKPSLTWLSPEVDLISYTEPDLEQVRKESYDKGYMAAYVKSHMETRGSYQQGLADAWEAARKIADMPYGEEEKVFGSGGWAFIINHTASEAIEKIRQYEQEQEESEESKKEQSVTAEEVMRQYLDRFCKGKSCTGCPLYTSDFTCGRGYHFLTNRVSDEEVRRAYSEVLEKMRERQEQ